MTEQTVTESTEAAAPLDDGERVNVGLDELIIGRPLKKPIYDMRGVLLLAEGSVITSDFKRLLRSHEIEDVKMHESDVESLTIRGKADAIDTSKSIFDTELTQQLDSVIDNGMLSVVNVGDAVKKSVVDHGRTGYDRQKRAELTTQHEESNEVISGMMQGALHGKNVDGGEIAAMAGKFLTDMTTDADCILTVAAEASQQQELSAHCLQMSLLGMAIGIEMGLDASNVRKLSLAGLVHDWGMIRVPEKIRKAPRPLTPMEFVEIKKHPIHILELLKNVSGIPSVVPLVCYQVHERVDGRGYPRGRHGNSIHQFAKILQVADAYVALTSPRPWRQPLMPYAAMECLVREARERIVDPAVVRALLHVVSLFPIGSFVALSDGSLGRVIRRNGQNYTKPIVQLIQDASGAACDPDADSSIIDLSQSVVEVEQALPTPGSKEIGLSDEIVELSCGR